MDKFAAGLEGRACAVLKGSEECYVFICVENGLSDQFIINYDTQSWLKVAEADGKAVYVYSTKVDALAYTSNTCKTRELSTSPDA